ncbi:oligosaccharide flippase family protein [Mucilaginibacter auburnensis]|uniref:O-antigen/teichoic acid export membrane protein n=1 Tax=Mucilaginibacter auburnensis TaxID=1457233 RepID=A0A2H9VSK6_9SPHI|nr:polysaccharide biosynthesis C-terminal domain-containing protein [Mucilaginibacter auburnensis]PJJ83772.1 O-antigen/teichoic acid export membrane protein [Mucilaginibacter auburnensis]
MGIVKAQAYKNTIISYAGMVIAYVNTVLLFPFFTNASEYGFYNLIITISVLYSLVASMGVPSMLAKYFPFYRTNDLRHNGFIHWAASLSLIGFVGATLLYVVFRTGILKVYDDSLLLPKYFYYIIPLAFFVIAFNFLEMTGRIVYRTIFSNVLQNVVLRLLTTFYLIMISLKWIDFSDFIMLYIVSNGLISLLLFINIAASGNFSHKVEDYRFKAIKKKEVMNFGLFTLLSSAVYVLLQKVDTLMITAMVSEKEQGIYSWYFNIAMIISVPAQALSRTTYAIVADSWKSNNMANINEVYSKTSIVQMVVGALLFIGIIVNRENLYALARNKEFTNPEYFSLFIVIGLGFMVDITGGLNTYIISTSHKYKLVTLMVLIASAICVGLNYVLIPQYGGLGAAIAYLITMGILNFITWFYIKYRFKMQPFGYRHLLVIVISAVSFAAGYYLWRMPNLYLDIIMRSGITAACYGLLTYLFKISPDINEKVDKTLALVKNKF